ncbi:hypothetical protein LCM27_15055 [Ruegeria marisrubri]|uniref:YybH family protein n=1 Tax=Ruegeria marisrubri TaxID=1685379 RepID=UPI001CD46566|nr:nuclear transport factor 2 family protein [Ruegeria marisrubri]MCA0907719.1 hypothetical protein [Ruegeria marisrubri]
MTQNTEIRAFIADWFARFDRLDPIDAFLADLHPDVDWDMPDADPRLSGHARVRAWYAGVLETFQSPTEHHASDIETGDGWASFNVLFRARTHAGDTVEAHVREDWRFDTRPDGRPLITHYSARLLEETNP